VDVRKLLALALLVTLALVQPAHGQTAQGSSKLQVGLGFSLGSVAPVSAGVPVYTVGDQLWFRSYTADTVNVTVTPPGSGSGQSFIVSRDIPGNTSENLFTFSSTDATGAWTLMASTSTQEVGVQFYVVSGGSPAVLSGYDLVSAGVLAMNYTLESGSAYDVSACTVGTQSTATVYVPVPSSLGGGTLLLGLNGTTVSVIPQEGSGSFTFWVGLSQNYAYQVNDSSAVLSKSMEVAQTAPAQVSGGLSGTFSTSLEDDVPMRTGEYTLSANFESSQGLTVHDTSVLVTGTGSWVWLQGCSEAASPLSTSVTVTASLNNGPAVWPRQVYVIYQQLGVELFSVVSVSVQPATVEMVASPWGQPLTDSQVEVSGASGFVAGNGTVYLIGQQYPIQISVGTPQMVPQNVSVGTPYSHTLVQVPADQVVVKTLSSGSPASGAEVSLYSDGTVATEASSGGAAVFYVPPGNYTVSGTFDGEVVTYDLTTHGAAIAGVSLPVTLEFNGGSSETLTYVLLGALGIGVVITGAIWMTVYRRSRVRVAPAAGQQVA